MMLAYSRFAARYLDGSWCYCAMGYDEGGVYGVVEVLASGFASTVEVCAHHAAARKVG